MPIPKHFHFCYGFDEKPQELLYAHYLAVRSALAINPGFTATLYYATPPTGPWWPKLRQQIEVRQVLPPATVHGRPLLHFAHRADVFRLQVLLDQGGVYLDMDTLCLRSLEDLLEHGLVMGLQLGRNAELYGLCNAVMLAQPGNKFLEAWFGEYRWFRSPGRHRFWDEHSVRVPRKLLEERPALRPHIHVVDHSYFFFPNFDRTDLLFSSQSLKGYEKSRCVHLWEQMAWNTISKLTPAAVRSGKSAYCQLARRFVAEEDQ